MNRTQKVLAIPLAAAALLVGGGTVAYTGLASAQTPTATTQTTGTPPAGMHGKWGMHRGPGAMGTVAAVSGNSITLTGKDGTTYTVDASAAQIDKISTVSVSDIKVGDTLGVEGTVSGNSVTAKHIMDGMPKPPQQQ